MRADRTEKDAQPSARSAPRKSRLGVFVVPLVIAIGVTFTWLAAHQTSLLNERSGERALAERANLVEVALRDRLLTYEAVLHSGVGLFQASDGVTADEWRTFVDQLQLAQSYPGLQGLGFTRRTHRAGDPTAGTAAQRDYTVIEYLEPLDARNREALGFDMMSEAVRRDAMERARDSGRAVLSGSVLLVQEITAQKQAGFLMYAPLYETKKTPITQEERRQLLVGYVYCPFRAIDFLTNALEDRTQDVHVEIFDTANGQRGQLLFNNAPEETTEVIDAVELTLDALGHEWLLRVTPHRQLYASLRTAPVWGVWALGSGATLLLAGLVWTLARSREHLSARLAAEQISGQRERHAYSVLANSLDAYISIDANDRILEWNRQAAIMFGWSEQEARASRLVDTIVPERYRTQHLAALESFHARAPRLVGRRVEMPAVRRDGSEITIELSIVASSRDDRQVFVASIRDITEIRKQQKEIASLTSTLEQRVQDRTRELAIANRDLHAANAQLEAFAQNVSHDLRAPLRAIEGYTRLVAEEQGSQLDQEARNHLSAVMRNARKMQRLIDDMLKLAFVGRQPIDKRMINLWTLVLGVLGDLHKPPGVVVHARPDELAEVVADPNLLEHALRNLLSNAIKFSQRSAQPTITIGATTISGERVFYVKDNGVGFEKKHAGRLFEVFHRLHRDQEFEGTGVGLTIVKNVIERHGGRVWADAEVGSGAIFYFTLSEPSDEATKRLAANER